MTARTRLLGVMFAVLVSRTATAQQIGTTVTYRQGQITFTQGGTDATWRLTQGSIDTVAGTWMVNLQYRPDSGRGSGLLMLTVTKLSQEMGGGTSLGRLTVTGGPAGGGPTALATYRTPAAKCVLTVTKLGPDGAEGSGTCTGQFQFGPAITRFRFTASR
jgi:hypothetical protein